jgi:hypothetical protein
MGRRHLSPISGIRMSDGKRANPRWCQLHCYPVCAEQRSGHAMVAQMFNSFGRPSSQEVRAVGGSGSNPRRLHVKQTGPISLYSLTLETLAISTQCSRWWLHCRHLSWQLRTHPKTKTQSKFFRSFLTFKFSHFLIFAVLEEDCFVPKACAHMRVHARAHDPALMFY